MIAGGGVAALEALMAFNELAGGYVDVELVTPTPEFAYRPLAVAEPFGLGEVAASTSSGSRATTAPPFTSRA